jgi:uncharacterized paraquat-inducible protein A
MVAVLGILLVGSFGCENGKMHMPWDKKSTTQDTMSMDASKDDCPMCPGIQHAKADGTCPECGMKVKG